MTKTIRLLTVDDAPRLAAHSLRAMAMSGVPPTPKFMARSRRDLPAAEVLIEQARTSWPIPVGEPGWSRCFGLFDAGGEIRGEAGLKFFIGKARAHRPWLWLGLEPEHRGQGDGRRLMEALIDWSALQPELAWLDLGVFSHNAAARRLYERLGFVEIGRMADAFRIDGESIDDIQMTLDLNQLRWR